MINHCLSVLVSVREISEIGHHKSSSADSALRLHSSWRYRFIILKSNSGELRMRAADCLLLTSSREVGLLPPAASLSLRPPSRYSCFPPPSLLSHSSMSLFSCYHPFNPCIHFSDPNLLSLSLTVFSLSFSLSLYLSLSLLLLQPSVGLMAQSIPPLRNN